MVTAKTKPNDTNEGENKQTILDWSCASVRIRSRVLVCVCWSTLTIFKGSMLNERNLKMILSSTKKLRAKDTVRQRRTFITYTD